MRGPDFVYRDFARVFVHADFGDLGGVRVSRGRPDAGAFVLAAARFRRRSVRAGTGEGTVKINRSDDRLLEGHGVFRTFVFALLLQRSAKNLTFDSATHRSLLGLLRRR